uniref:Uncharacterized protein n=1 Tax=Arundo donax TaxID=35708 RepID=A0A0A9BR08_ARUDO
MDLMGRRRKTSVMISSGSSATALDGMNFVLLLLRHTSAGISPGRTTVPPDSAKLLLLLHRIMSPHPDVCVE